MNAGVERIHVVSRSLARAHRVADNVREQGVAADAQGLEHICGVLGASDVVVLCTGAVRPVVTLADADRALAGRW